MDVGKIDGHGREKQREESKLDMVKGSNKSLPTVDQLRNIY